MSNKNLNKIRYDSYMTIWHFYLNDVEVILIYCIF